MRKYCCWCQNIQQSLSTYFILLRVIGRMLCTECVDQMKCNESFDNDNDVRLYISASVKQNATGCLLATEPIHLICVFKCCWLMKYITPFISPHIPSAHPTSQVLQFYTSNSALHTFGTVYSKKPENRAREVQPDLVCSAARADVVCCCVLRVLLRVRIITSTRYVSTKLYEVRRICRTKYLVYLCILYRYSGMCTKHESA